MIITVTKINEPIYFDREFSGFKTIKLKSVTLFNSFYNVWKYEINDPDYKVIDDDSERPTWYNIQLEEGFYSNVDFIDSIYAELLNKSANIKKLKMWVNNKKQFCIKNDTGYQFRLLNDHFLGFRDKWINDITITSSCLDKKPYQFNYFYLYCDILDTYDNYLDENPSDVLEILPVIESNKFESKHTYNENFTPKLIKSRFNKIKIDIKDENGNDIDFHGYPFLIQLEIL